MHLNADQRSNGIVVLLSAFLATVSALLGYDTIACHGLLAGAGSALLRAGFLVFVHPGTLVTCLGLLALFAGIAHGLTRWSPFRARRELVTFLLPVSAFLAGMAVGFYTTIGPECALHPWA
ncbi:MAG: hypothetical protein KA505_10345 [Xanthomonadales bacterium]|nr:hypothetical protein [Xanthomonadales bacterium]MBP6079201.1 hypothetical protein [Xanthomonadales bacterium]MBP7622924.1 hypothetical protein [Xanthomonadales bacterium]